MNGMETQERTVPQIELRGLSKVYQIPGGEVQALNNINLTIEQGDIYGIIGMSGAGKSTLIRCLNRLDSPTVPLEDYFYWDYVVAGTNATS